MEPSSPISQDEENKLPELFDFTDTTNEDELQVPLQDHNLEDDIFNLNDENDYEVPQEHVLDMGDDNNERDEETTEPPEYAEEDKRDQRFEGIDNISDLIESIIVTQDLFPGEEFFVSDLSAQVCAEFQHRVFFTHKHKIGKHGNFTSFTYGVNSEEGFMSENFILLFRKCNQLVFYFPSSTLVGTPRAFVNTYDIRDTFSPCEVRIISINQNQEDQSLTIEIENVIPNNNNNNNNNNNESSACKKIGRGNAVHPNVFVLLLEDDIGPVASLYIFAYRRTRGTLACSKKARKYISENPFRDGDDDRF